MTPRDAAPGQATRNFLAQWREMLQAPYPLLYLQTDEEERALEWLARLAQHDARPLHIWTPARGTTPEGPPSTLEEVLATVIAAPDGAIFALGDALALVDSPARHRALLDVERHAARHHKSLVFTGLWRTLEGELGRTLVRLAMPLPEREHLVAELERALPASQFAEMGPERREALVNGAMGLTLREAARAFVRLRQQWIAAKSRSETPPDLEATLLAEKRRIVGQDDALEFCDATTGLDDVGGVESLKEWLDTRKSAFGAEARRYGLPAPRGLLLLGVQGCGKSLAAKAVARHWSLPLLRLELGAVFDGRRPADEALRRALRMAEALAPCVMWVDEIEKTFAAAQGDAATSRALGALLTWQQERERPVFTVATANEVQGLPPDLLRKGRFDEIFFLDLPEIHERREILGIHLRRFGRQLDAAALGEVARRCEHFSGAELEQVVVSALYAAFACAKEPGVEDLVFAAQNTVPLYRTYEERIKALRDWATHRARPASRPRRVLDFFGAP